MTEGLDSLVLALVGLGAVLLALSFLLWPAKKDKR